MRNQQELLRLTRCVDHSVEQIDHDCSVDCEFHQYDPTLQTTASYSPTMQRPWIVVDETWW